MLDVEYVKIQLFFSPIPNNYDFETKLSIYFAKKKIQCFSHSVLVCHSIPYKLKMYDTIFLNFFTSRNYAQIKNKLYYKYILYVVRISFSIQWFCLWIF